jgi:hypothetical protein
VRWMRKISVILASHCRSGPNESLSIVCKSAQNPTDLSTKGLFLRCTTSSNLRDMKDMYVCVCVWGGGVSSHKVDC